MEGKKAQKCKKSAKQRAKMYKNAPFCTDACNTPVYYTPVNVSVHPMKVLKTRPEVDFGTIQEKPMVASHAADAAVCTGACKKAENMKVVPRKALLQPDFKA